MKKIALVILLISLLILNSCIPGNELRPVNRVPSEWKCDDPEITIQIFEYVTDSSAFDHVIGDEPDGMAAITTEDGIIICEVGFATEPIVYFTKNYEILLEGRAEYYEDKFIMNVKEGYEDNIFGRKYETLTFNLVWEGETPENFKSITEIYSKTETSDTDTCYETDSETFDITDTETNNKEG